MADLSQTSVGRGSGRSKGQGTMEERYCNLMSHWERRLLSKVLVHIPDLEIFIKNGNFELFKAGMFALYDTHTVGLVSVDFISDIYREDDLKAER